MIYPNIDQDTGPRNRCTGCHAEDQPPPVAPDKSGLDIFPRIAVGVFVGTLVLSAIYFVVNHVNIIEGSWL